MEIFKALGKIGKFESFLPHCFLHIIIKIPVNDINSNGYYKTKMDYLLVISGIFSFLVSVKYIQWLTPAGPVMRGKGGHKSIKEKNCHRFDT